MVETAPALTSYDQLRNIASECPIAPLQFERFKSSLSTAIGSVRRRYCIKTIRDLIDCLERRDELSATKIEPLHDLTTYTAEAVELEAALANYVIPKEYTNAEPMNQYQQLRLAEERQQQQLNKNLHNGNARHGSAGEVQERDEIAEAKAALKSNATSTHTPRTAAPTASTLTQPQRTAVYKILSRELGNYWRRFGRELNIGGDAVMDEIEIQYPRDLTSRIHRLMQLFEEDDSHDASEHGKLICRALDGCQRKDLRRKVESLLSSKS